MIENKVKLVIWDLDDTFWQGTLSEEDVAPIQSNIDVIFELSRRGIVNSICSKNDQDQAIAKLNEFGVYEHFVFPVISFDPKGKAVARIIEDANLRPQNVLFIDDNLLNLEEVKFFNPGIAACHPVDILHILLEHPHLAGKPDPELTRLKQYQFLQKKVKQRSTTEISNEAFLRASGIRVTIDIDVEQNFERVVELINRSNQLNYTKLRLETPEKVSEFRCLLNEFGYQAGCIHVIDNYGDYGLVGFFLLHRRAGIKKLIHFVFSCRAMHMGVEQYIYEMLGRPEIDIVQPVSYGLDSHSKIDWIHSANRSSHENANSDNPQLLLLGGCDLLQLASFCSSNRVEFVNKIQDGMKVRYEDPGFILSDRTALQNSKSIRKVPLWTYEDALLFDESVASSKLILLSLWPAARGFYLKTVDGILIHSSKELFKRLKKTHAEWLEHDVQVLTSTINNRLALITDSLNAIAKNCRPDAVIFLFGCYTRGEQKKDAREDRLLYNRTCQSYCADNASLFRFVDVDAIVPPKFLVDRVHFTREGYFQLARYILDNASEPVGFRRALNAA